MEGLEAIATEKWNLVYKCIIKCSIRSDRVKLYEEKD